MVGHGLTLGQWQDRLDIGKALRRARSSEVQNLVRPVAAIGQL